MVARRIVRPAPTGRRAAARPPRASRRPCPPIARPALERDLGLARRASPSRSRREPARPGGGEQRRLRRDVDEVEHRRVRRAASSHRDRRAGIDHPDGRRVDREVRRHERRREPGAVQQDGAHDARRRRPRTARERLRRRRRSGWPTVTRAAPAVRHAYTTACAAPPAPATTTSAPASDRPIAASTPARKPGASLLNPTSRPSSVRTTLLTAPMRPRVGLDLVDEAGDHRLVRRGHAEARATRVRAPRRRPPRPRPARAPAARTGRRSRPRRTRRRASPASAAA